MGTPCATGHPAVTVRFQVRPKSESHRQKQETCLISTSTFNMPSVPVSPKLCTMVWAGPKTPGESYSSSYACFCMYVYLT